jgi:hypothetical protein
MNIEREDYKTKEKTIVPLDVAVAEIKTYGVDFFEQYFQKDGIWLTYKNIIFKKAKEISVAEESNQQS